MGLALQGHRTFESSQQSNNKHQKKKKIIVQQQLVISGDVGLKTVVKVIN